MTIGVMEQCLKTEKLVKAFKQRVSSLVALTKLPPVINSITENVEVGAGGGKKLDFDTIYGYARLAYGLPAGHFFQVQIDPNRVTGYAELSTSIEALRTAIHEFLTPDVAAAGRAAAVATGKKPKGPAAPPPSEVTLEVLNGNGVAGAADEAAYLLSQRGYQTSNGGNADKFDYFHTKVVYDPNVAGADKAAKVVAQLFGDAEAEAAPPDTAMPTMLSVILGQTFKNTLGPGAIDQTPKHEPPRVVVDPDSVRPLIQEAQRQVRFPLLLPTVREQYSRLYAGASGPIRVYRVDGHDSVRLVYQLTGTDYWGIQEVAWPDAPMLGGPSSIRTLKGREYRLYFNGSKLHIVAIIENGAAYWVVNTLLDKLTNETMLAIAKGLKPLRSSQ